MQVIEQLSKEAENGPTLHNSVDNLPLTPRGDLVKLLIDADVKAKDVAKELGLPETSLSKVLRGKRPWPRGYGDRSFETAVRVVRERQDAGAAA